MINKNIWKSFNGVWNNAYGTYDLYKLMNLYLLKQDEFSSYQCTADQLFTEHDYTTYFTLQQALNELEDAGLIHKEASHSSTRYDITKEGEETLNFFGKNISPAIINDMMNI